MKSSAALLLVSLMLSIAAPFTIHISATDDVDALITLDLCNASHSSISVNSDSPAVQEATCCVAPAGLAGHIETDYRNSVPFVPGFKEDRPPKA